MTVVGSMADEDGRSEIAYDHRGRISRTEIQLSLHCPGSLAGRYVTMDDFPGLARVLVKDWSPNRVEWYWLVRGRTRVADAHRKAVPA